VLATIDRYLTAPMVHELCHFAPDRDAIAPPHLDECIAGWLGVHIHAGVMYPAGDHDDALYAAPWLAQVVRAIARAFGVGNLVRAHAGGDQTALPHAFATAAAQLGLDNWRARRMLHFLSDTFDPAPWVALALAVGADRPSTGERSAKGSKRIRSQARVGASLKEDSACGHGNGRPGDPAALAAILLATLEPPSIPTSTARSSRTACARCASRPARSPARSGPT
jgi:hypothetical protein